MLIGHYAPALIAKGLKPTMPLWQLFIAVQLVDIAWVSLCVVKLEFFSLDPTLATNPLVLEHQPFSHSLAAMAMWSLACFCLVGLVNGRQWTEAGLVSALVASHWLLDLPVHRPDLLVWGNWKVGLALWDHTYLALALELVFFAVCAVWACRRASLGRYTPALLAILSVALIGNYLAYPPLDHHKILWSAMAVYLLVPLAAWWLERRPTTSEVPVIG